MATTLATLTGDLSDITDADFTNALVRVRANTTSVVDPDNNKIRILEPEWISVNPDGTFTFPNLIAGADTVVPGTLQYYLDVKVVGVEQVRPLGPFVLAAGSQDVTDLTPATPVDFNSTIPVVIDDDVLAAAQTYTDAALEDHIDDANPHQQYLRFVDVNGNPLSVPIVFARVGDPFPPVTLGAVLIYGGV